MKGRREASGSASVESPPGSRTNGGVGETRYYARAAAAAPAVDGIRTSRVESVNQRRVTWEAMRQHVCDDVRDLSVCAK